MPRNGQPSMLPCQVRKGRWHEKQHTSGELLVDPSSTPLPKASYAGIQAPWPWEGPYQRKWGHLGVCPWSSGKQPQGLEPGTIGLIGPAKGNTQNHQRLGSSIPLFQLKTPTHRAKHHLVRVRVCTEERAAEERCCTACLGIRACRGPYTWYVSPDQKGSRTLASLFLPFSQHAAPPPWALEGFTMNSTSAILFVLFLRDPHLLKSVQ